MATVGPLATLAVFSMFILQSSRSLKSSKFLVQCTKYLALLASAGVIKLCQEVQNDGDLGKITD